MIMHHKHGGDIYSYRQIQDFSANINELGMPESVKKAAEKAVTACVHYPDPEYRSLRSALARREKVEEKMMICGNGAAELMFALAAARRPSRAFLAVPSFFEYEQALSAFGCEVHHYPLKESCGFAVTGDFLEAVPEGTDMMIIGNPNNPTGQIVSRDVLEKLLSFCGQHHVFLVLDESFFDFLTEEDQRQTLAGVSAVSEQPDLFVLKSFTKMYAMPGLRFGYGICSNCDLLDRMREVMQPWNVSIPAQMAAEAAASETEFARISALRTAQNRSKVKRQMETCGYQVYESSVNFLLFRDPYAIDAATEGQDTGNQPRSDLHDFCLRHGYLIRDCSNFPGLSKGYYRICVRSREENEALLAVLQDWAKLHQRSAAQ